MLYFYASKITQNGKFTFDPIALFEQYSFVAFCAGRFRNFAL